MLMSNYLKVIYSLILKKTYMNSKIFNTQFV